MQGMLEEGEPGKKGEKREQSDTMVVLYLRKKIEKGGPENGLNPKRAAKVERKWELGVVYP